MPTYEYRCRECGDTLEVVQSFTDDPLTECPACAGELRKVFAPPGISFKGDGFYKTDSRGKPAKSGASSSNDDNGSPKDGEKVSSKDGPSKDSSSSSSSSDSKGPASDSTGSSTKKDAEKTSSTSS